MNTKRCNKCGQVKPVHSFTMKKRNSNGVAYADLGKPNVPHSQCKQCACAYQREYMKKNRDKKRASADASRFKQTYGLVRGEYEQMLEDQNHKCAICNKPETARRYGKVMRLAVDHCHTTGKVRGLLCSSCNNMLGRVKDNSDYLMSAVMYLRESGTCRSRQK